MVTETQIQKAIARERKRIAKEQRAADQREKLRDLQRELFKLRTQKTRKIAEGVGSFLKRGGRGIREVARKAAPMIQKQSRLIRQQQLRDDALARKRSKVKKKTKSRPKSGLINSGGVFDNIDF